MGWLPGKDWLYWKPYSELLNESCLKLKTVTYTENLCFVIIGAG